MTQALTSAETRALKLLGDGINPATVASAVGLSESRISQLLSDESFARQVADLRYQNLIKHNQRDLSYDEMEDALLAKLKDLLPFLMKPMEIIRSIQIINAAKRRGASAPDSIVQQHEVIQLVMPVQVINQFTLNQAGQVVRAGQQDLVTVQSGQLTNLVQSHRKALTNEPASHPAAT